MYITNGSLKRRKLATRKGIRLVEARIRQVVFNVCGAEFAGKTVLDLFGGCGTLGLEALSWGAERALFGDIDRESVSVIRKNVNDYGLSSQATVYQMDAESLIARLARQKEVVDIVFLDPPYNRGLLTKILHTLNEYDILNRSGSLILLGSVREPVDITGFSCTFERCYGDRHVMILEKK
jgi:16S rRNA (guanine966-N2)-methyltransferase